MKTNSQENKYQKIFIDLVFGTLIYSVVLGFFNDYTNLLSITSYSSTFLSAFVLQVLTLVTLELKTYAFGFFKKAQTSFVKGVILFIVWLIMFLSKFVFLAVLDFIFGTTLEISGFVSLVIIIVSMLVIQKLIEATYSKLED